jgi:hypothetical protein
MFLTNKENFVATDGDYAGTQINSSNMLWSLSGNIALIYKVLFGIHYNENSLQFNPFVPKALAGERTLEHYKYRRALLNISMSGYGNQVKTMMLDGKPVADGTISADLTGEHTVKIVLANNVLDGKSNLAPGYTAPETPVAAYKKGRLSWDKITGAVSYRILKNGKNLATVSTTGYTMSQTQYAEYQVASIDAKGVGSFYSEPVEVIPTTSIDIIQAESVAAKSDRPYQGFSGDGFVEISKTKNTKISIPVTVKEDGVYAIDFRYANGNGPINTENKCAIRTLNVDDRFSGTVVFPQRGKGEWSNWGFSNSVHVKLKKGAHTVTLQFKDANENMNGEINQAMIDYVRVVRISGS